ncbi:uncharacterized protein LOC144155332 isoform X2 [Haemaphysalis longicornis]
MGAVVAPGWNRVGPFLCEGRNFLVETGPLSAVEWELLVTERESRLALTAVVIRLEQMTLSYLLGVSTVGPVLHYRLRAGEVAIRPVICYVLPSMKTARAVAVSFAPLPGWEYSSFLDLKIYWKNTYGYRIPEDSESTMTYVKVCFQTDSRFYIYPILCVRPKLPQPVPNIDPRPIVDRFMECVKLKMAKLLNTTARGPAYPTPALHWTAKDAEAGMDAVSCTPRPSCGRVPARTSVSFETRPMANFMGDVKTNVGSQQAGRSIPLSKPLVPASTTVPLFQPSQGRFDVSRVAAGRNLGPLVAPSSKPPHSWPIQLGEMQTTAPKLSEWLLPNTPAKELQQGQSERYQPGAACGSKPKHGWPTQLGEKKTAPAEGLIPDGPPEKQQPQGRSMHNPSAVVPGSKPPHSWPTWLAEKKTTPAERLTPNNPPPRELPRGRSMHDQPAVASSSKPGHSQLAEKKTTPAGRLIPDKPPPRELPRGRSMHDQPAVASSSSKPGHSQLAEKKTTPAGRLIPDKPPPRELPRGRSMHDQPAVASSSKPGHSQLAEKKTTPAGRLIPDKPPPRELPRGLSMHDQPAFTSSSESKDSWLTRQSSRLSESASARAAKWRMLNSVAFESDSEAENSLPSPLKKEEAPHSKVLKWLNSIEPSPKELPHGRSMGHHPSVAASVNKNKGSRRTTLKEEARPKSDKWQLRRIEPPSNNPPRRRPERGQPTYAAMMAQQQMLASMNESQAPQRSTASTAAWQYDDVSRRRSVGKTMFRPHSATVTRPGQQACEQPMDVLNTHGAVPNIAAAFNSARMVHQHVQDPRTTHWPQNDRQAQRQHPTTGMKQSGSVPAVMSSVPKITLGRKASLQSTAITSTSNGIHAHSAQTEMASSSHASNANQKGVEPQATKTRIRTVFSPMRGTVQEGRMTTTGQQERTHGHWTVSEVDCPVKERKNQYFCHSPEVPVDSSQVKKFKSSH